MRLKKKHLITAGLLVLVVCAFSWILYRTAWLCDDAYITFRTVDNFTHGYGMRWNIGERVQSFTHPLWFFLLSACSWFSGELYYTSLFLSIVLTLVMLILFCLSGRDEILKTAPLLAVLLFSRAFIDYSTSGLENPLSHLLILVFLTLYSRGEGGYLRLFLIALTSALGILTRPDLALFFFPCLLHAWYGYRDKKAVAALAAGFVPLAAWLVFSLLYYGFLFPNTAYAKLGTGIPAGELWIQGLRYLQNSVSRDPLTLTAIILAGVLPFALRQFQLFPAALGIILYLLYIVRIGGDFMSGRFLTPPLVFGLVLLARMPFRIGSKLGAGLLLLTVALGTMTPRPTVLSGSQYGKDTSAILDSFLIADERAFYYRKTGLAAPESSKPGSDRTVIGKKRAEAERAPLQVVERDTTGMSGYLAGPGTHIIDLYALSDPLLARLPALYAPKWRIGHFWRHVPEGYNDSLSTGRNVITDPGLAAYYDRLSLVVRGPLLSLERWKTIAHFHLGSYDHLIDKDLCRFPNLKRLSAAQVGNGPEAVLLSAPEDADKGGVEIAWGHLRHDAALHLEVEGGPYYVLFMKDADIAGLLPKMPASILDARGIEPGVTRLEVPVKTQENGFNALRVMPLNASGTLRILQAGLSQETSAFLPFDGK